MPFRASLSSERRRRRRRRLRIAITFASFRGFNSDRHYNANDMRARARLIIILPRGAMTSLQDCIPMRAAAYGARGAAWRKKNSVYRANSLKVLC